MKRSTDRILVSHAGVLPRPPDLVEIMAAGGSRDDEFLKRLPGAVADVVQKQIECGVDVVNDGEQGKRGGFNGYVRERLTGIEQREARAGEVTPHNVQGRDAREFPNFFASGGGGFNRAGTRGGRTPAFVNQPFFCTGPIKYIGQEAVKRDVANLKAALQGKNVAEAYLPAIAPGTIEHWLWNQHYNSEEDFLFAIADAMNEENKAIVEGGFILQIDDPDLPDGWQMFPEMSPADYRKYAELRVEAINRSLRDIPEDRVRLHICWGSGHGPHKNDLPLEEFVQVVLQTKAEQISVEAANPRHDHDWHVWETVKLPAGKSYMPGVAGHATDIIEHPRLIADRLIRYAKLMGRENVIAGTDCGLGSRVGHAEIAWAKLSAMAEGARIASKELWS